MAERCRQIQERIEETRTEAREECRNVSRTISETERFCHCAVVSSSVTNVAGSSIVIGIVTC